MKQKFEFLIILLATSFVTVVGIQSNTFHFAQTQSLATITEVASFYGAFTWVKSAGYFLMFVAMVIEGPIITSAAAFAATLGYFNIFVVLILSVLGDLVGDFGYYAIGYFGRVSFVEKHGDKVGLTKERMERMERLIKEHPKKTLAAIKLAPAVIPAAGLMMVGATRMPFRQYTWMTLITTLPKTIIFMLLGYYFGRAYDAISQTLQNGEYLIVVALVVIVAIFYLYKKLTAKISLRLESI